MIVSLPPLDLKTMRWADPSDEMSIVSSPASPSIVIVFSRRLVVEKSPTMLKVSPGPAPPVVPLGSTLLMRISSISRSSAMIDAAFVPLRVITISVAPLSTFALFPGSASQAARV